MYCPCFRGVSLTFCIICQLLQLGYCTFLLQTILVAISVWRNRSYFCCSKTTTATFLGPCFACISSQRHDEKCFWSLSHKSYYNPLFRKPRPNQTKLWNSLLKFCGGIAFISQNSHNLPPNHFCTRSPLIRPPDNTSDKFHSHTWRGQLPVFIYRLISVTITEDDMQNLRSQKFSHLL